MLLLKMIQFGAYLIHITTNSLEYLGKLNGRRVLMTIKKALVLSTLPGSRSTYRGR